MSPNGRYVALARTFAVERRDDTDKRGIWLIDVLTGSARRLAWEEGAVADKLYPVSWSPDSKRLKFARSIGDDQEDIWEVTLR